jgi:1,2-diacylglycerol 3-alpha-glucosyltransferase
MTEFPEEKMKIAFISLFKRGLGGGESRVAHELARQFAAYHNVALICPADQTGRSQDESGLTVFGVRSAGDGEFQMPALSAKTVSGMFDFLDDFQPDVVHAHEPALMGLIGQIWAKMNLVPFVHTSHVLPAKVLDFGATDALDVKLLQGSLSETVTRRALTNFYENCDAIIALNNPALEALRRFGYKERLFVIPNGRDLQRYTSCSPADTSAQEKVLSFVGYISQRKNQVYLLKTLKHLPENYRLRLIGKPLNPDYGRQLESLSKDLGLNNVSFLGQIPHEEIPSQLEQSHLFVSASKMEVQSLVVIEALASGTPVVGLSNETIDEFIDEEVGCWLPKDANPESFARCVERICHLPQPDYEQLCAKARQKVEHLDWSNIVAQTVEAYGKLLEEKPPITEEKGAKLADLISLLASGEVERILTDRIEMSKEERKARTKRLLGLALPAKLRPLTRVPSSTWLLAGLTILGSLVGYMTMKWKKKANG